jgi:competence protein ComEC
MTDTAIAGGRLGRVPEPGRRLFTALAGRLAAEGERRLLWLPVFFGAGIGLYFALRFEPPLWLGPAALLSASGGAAAARRYPAWRGAALVLAVAAAGFAWMQLRARQAGGPMLERRLGPLVITGRVVDIDALDRGWRLILAPDPLPGLGPDQQPRLLRLHIPPSSDALVPGEHARMKAMLYPVPGQILPGSHDMQRDAYFAGIGGVGYTYGGVRCGR